MTTGLCRTQVMYTAMAEQATGRSTTAEHAFDLLLHPYPHGGPALRIQVWDPSIIVSVWFDSRNLHSNVWTDPTALEPGVTCTRIVGYRSAQVSSLVSAVPLGDVEISSRALTQVGTLMHALHNMPKGDMQSLLNSGDAFAKSVELMHKLSHPLSVAKVDAFDTWRWSHFAEKLSKDAQSASLEVEKGTRVVDNKTGSAYAPLGWGWLSNHMWKQPSTGSMVKLPVLRRGLHASVEDEGNDVVQVLARVLRCVSERADVGVLGTLLGRQHQDWMSSYDYLSFPPARLVGNVPWPFTQLGLRWGGVPHRGWSEDYRRAGELPCGLHCDADVCMTCMVQNTWKFTHSGCIFYVAT